MAPERPGWRRWAMKEINATDRHKVGGRLNNRAENSHQPFRRRERAMQRFRNMKTLQKFSSVHAQPQPFHSRAASGHPADLQAETLRRAAPRRRRDGEGSLDVELADLPPAARWREWMLRVEAAIFASAGPVAREALVRLVGQHCRFDDLIADLIHELRDRPYDIVLVAGGYALRTKTRFAPAIRVAHPGRAGDEVAELTRTESFVLTAIAYLQPITRGEISRLAGREISRDVIASLKRHGLSDGAIRAPQPGAPFAYVTTKRFFEVFGFATLRELPDLERVKEKGLLQEWQGERHLDSILGTTDGDDEMDAFEEAEK
jgi:segregation and condensation protein B